MKSAPYLGLGRFAAIVALAILLLPAVALADAVAPAAGGDRIESAVPARPAHRQPEQLIHKPSGFWTSNRPAQGGAYKYRLLGIGVGLVIITGIVTIWVVRRHARTEP